MSILVTGGLGYIGSNTVYVLLKNNYKVVIIDNLSNSSIDVLDKFNMLYPNNEIIFYNCDVNNNIKLNEIFAEHNIYAVIHFAGLKSVPESIEKPLEYYYNNINGTINLLKIMKEHNVKNFIFSSSATVYGNQKSPLKEIFETGKGISNPYGKSKFIIEEILKDFKWFNIWCLRYFNPIGSDDSGLLCDNPNGIPNNIMPYIIRVAKGIYPTLNVFGDDYNTIDGTCLRDYIHVVDLANAHVNAIQHFKEGFNVVNIGTGQGISVLQLVKTVEKVNNIKLNYRICKRRAGDIDIMFCDASKAYELLGWKPIKTFEDMCNLQL